MNRNLFADGYDHAAQLREMLQPSTRKEVISSRAAYIAKISTRRIHDKKKAQFRKAHPDADRGIHRFIGVEPKLTGAKLESVNRNAAALGELAARTPEDWLARIKKLEAGHPALARACACFVYWDYISLRADFAKWTQFDKWAMSRLVPVECFDLIAALIWLGWTPFEADMRVNGSEGIVELRIVK